MLKNMVRVTLSKGACNIPKVVNQRNGYKRKNKKVNNLHNIIHLTSYEISLNMNIEVKNNFINQQ